MSKLIIIFCILLSSCTSTKSIRNVASDDGVKIEDDYNWVESLDFDKKTETKYQADKDEFKNVSAKDEEAHVLVKESISNLPPVRLEEQFKESDDPLSKIVIRCAQSKFEEAFLIVDQNYSQFKNNTSYWNQVGTCYYLKGDYSKAILFYNKSRDLDPKFSPPINNLGVVYQKQGRHQKALAAYKKANELSEFSVTPSFNLARIYLQFGIISKATPILQGLYKKSPQDSQVAAALGAAYLIGNDFNNSILIYSTLAKDVLIRPEVGLNYALALVLSGKIDEAKSILSSVQESSGELKQYASRVEALVRK